MRQINNSINLLGGNNIPIIENTLRFSSTEEIRQLRTPDRNRINLVNPIISTNSNFYSLEQYILDRTQQLELEGNLYEDNDPDDLFINSDTLRSILNPNGEVIIGNDIYKFVDKWTVVRVQNMDWYLIEKLRSLSLFHDALRKVTVVSRVAKNDEEISGREIISPCDDENTMGLRFMNTTQSGTSALGGSGGGGGGGGDDDDCCDGNSREKLKDYNYSNNNKKVKCVLSITNMFWCAVHDITAKTKNYKRNGNRWKLDKADTIIAGFSGSIYADGCETLAFSPSLTTTEQNEKKAKANWSDPLLAIRVKDDSIISVHEATKDGDNSGLYNLKIKDCD